MTVIFGLALAGGRSSRFGREKAVEPFGGEPMIAWTLRVLAVGAAEVAVNAPAGSACEVYARSKGLTCLADAEGAAAGPLAGVQAGLRWAARAGAEWLATSPCDTPLLPLDLVGRLKNAVEGDPAIVQTKDGLQPLCALWPTAALTEIEACTDHPPIRDVLGRIGARTVFFKEAAAFANLNTPDEFSRAQARLKTL